MRASLILMSLIAVLLSGCSRESADSKDKDTADTGYGGKAKTDGTTSPRWTFSYSLADAGAHKPRGGTTTGGPTTPITEARPEWTAIQAAGIDTFERDRRAILAMAGTYAVHFDFVETVGLLPGYKRAGPYQSWATEQITVIEDSGKRIVLQHILVMFFKQKDGSLSEPMVVKHWRQDWTYEDTTIWRHQGHGSWKHEAVDSKLVAGQWSQAVFGVVDEPRYEALGRWQHTGNESVWVSGDTWRPLPRREFSVRDDYQVLAGTNTHRLTPTGWVHEQHNRKLRLTAAGVIADKDPVVAVEVGLNRYQALKDFDASAGTAFWQRSAPYWQDVREAWNAHFAANKELTVTKKVDGKSLVMTLFSHAYGISDEKPYDSAVGSAFIAETLGRHLAPTSSAKR